MKLMTRSFFIAAFCVSANYAMAAEQTVMLNVENMSCVTCRYIVKKTLARLEGVKEVDVSFRKSTATVTYDDQYCSVGKLADAASQAGFPATPVKQ